MQGPQGPCFCSLCFPGLGLSPSSMMPTASPKYQIVPSALYFSGGLKQALSLHPPCPEIFGIQALKCKSSLPIWLMASIFSCPQGTSWGKWLSPWLTS